MCGEVKALDGFAKAQRRLKEEAVRNASQGAKCEPNNTIRNA